MRTLQAFERSALQNTYAKWARVYDYVYLPLFASVHKMVARLAAEAGRDILEIGFGTGLMLRYYPRDCVITGVDLSHHMLREVHKRNANDETADVTGLSVMDATHLAFRSESFDAVTLPFVLPLIPNPEAALDEAARVIKKGGRLVITSRFGAEGGRRAEIEKKIEPLFAKMGWSSAFKVSRIEAWAEKRGGMRLISDESTFCYRVISLEKTGS